MRRRWLEARDCTIFSIVGTMPVAWNVKPSKLRVEKTLQNVTLLCRHYGGSFIVTKR